ncbi:hypothetical protein [Polyangium sp. y55x31]|uniref:hypothetical protein n=1 Tax=Polyangium sp. y55x31 TaxID=3042688 RepID=UPI00248235D7|nr:hypothetical protein [Polyangium sp. y55x31]MDI1478486.1 hypothetical protein [Polyangium sp. y55x31]
MSDASAQPRRRRGLAIAGAVSGVLVVSLGAFSFWLRGGVQDGPNDPSDAGDEVASSVPHIAPSGSPARSDARDAGSNDFFVGDFSDLIGANRDEQAVLVVRDGSWKRRAQHAYFVVHLDGRTEDEFVLSSEGYDHETEDPSALNTPESRAILGRLEALARRFRRMGAWLPFLAFPSAESWHVRFFEDGSAEIDTNQTRWSWVRWAGSPDFVHRSQDSKVPWRVAEGLPVVSYDYDDGRWGDWSEGMRDVCFFWEEPPAARRKLTCSNGIHHASIVCDRGICGLLTKGLGLAFSLIDHRGAQILADGYVSGVALDAPVDLAVNDAGRVAISYGHSSARMAVVDLRTGIFRERRDSPPGPPATVWLDDQTLIACDAEQFSKHRSLVRLSLDDESAWTIRESGLHLRTGADGGVRR